MKKFTLPVMAIIGSSMLMTSCQSGNVSSTTTETGQPATGYDTSFKVEAESFGDLQVLRYQVPGFNELSTQQKLMSYYLYEAALAGRDIIYDQKSKYGLLLRKTVETVYGTYNGDKTTADWKKFEDYAGRFWFSNGNHHHYSNEKFIPEHSYEYFATLVKGSDQSKLPLEQGESVDAF